MDGIRTRGHEAALRAVGAMIRGGAPHAVLLVGPAGVGKTTLAMDLAAGLLCTDADPAARPCGGCRACRLVASGGHPDVHRLGPEGPGRQVVIGGPGAKARGIRDLVAELALLPVEGGARIAVIEAADRMNEDAQAALLKTLEEPPTGVTLILCADAEEPLLPTIRSRCARLRLGPVGARAVEAVLAEHGYPDPALAARLARITGGAPGEALTWAADPGSLRLRDELTRTLLDLTDATIADRLSAIRAAAASATALAGRSATAASPAPPAATPPATGPAATGSTAGAEAGASGEAAGGDPAEEEDAATTPARASASERRRAAEALIAVWTDTARDLALAQHAATGSLHDHRLLEETVAVATDLPPAAVIAFLDRLGRAGVLLAGNVAPELVLDDLAVAWPQRHPVAA